MSEYGPNPYQINDSNSDFAMTLSNYPNNPSFNLSNVKAVI